MGHIHHWENNNFAVYYDIRRFQLKTTVILVRKPSFLIYRYKTIMLQQKSIRKNT